MSLANVTGGLSVSAAAPRPGSISRAPSAPKQNTSLMVGSLATGRSLNNRSLMVSMPCVKGGHSLRYRAWPYDTHGRWSQNLQEPLYARYHVRRELRCDTEM